MRGYTILHRLWDFIIFFSSKILLVASENSLLIFFNLRYTTSICFASLFWLQYGQFYSLTFYSWRGTSWKKRCLITHGLQDNPLPHAFDIRYEPIRPSSVFTFIPPSLPAIYQVFTGRVFLYAQISFTASFYVETRFFNDDYCLSYIGYRFLSYSSLKCWEFFLKFSWEWTTRLFERSGSYNVLSQINAKNHFALLTCMFTHFLFSY